MQANRFGSSLPGNAVWQIANARPPHLKAIAPDVACTNCYQTVWHPGGMLLGPGRESRSGHEYESVSQLRGSMSQMCVAEPAAFERANYLKVLQSWRPDPALGRA